MVELLVVLTLLGLTSGMAVLAVGSLRAPAAAESVERLRRARERAIATKAAVVDTVGGPTIRLLPDGRVLGGTLDPLTGEARDSVR